MPSPFPILSSITSFPSFIFKLRLGRSSSNAALFSLFTNRKLQIFGFVSIVSVAAFVSIVNTPLSHRHAVALSEGYAQRGCRAVSARARD